MQKQVFYTADPTEFEKYFFEDKLLDHFLLVALEDLESIAPRHPTLIQFDKVNRG